MDRSEFRKRRVASIRHRLESQRAGRSRGGPYFYIWAHVIKGDTGKYVDVLDGPYNSYNEADAEGSRTVQNGTYTIEQFDTASRSEATRIMKKRRQGKENMSLSQTISNVRHKGKDIGFGVNNR